MADGAVQRFDRVGGVDGFAYVVRMGIEGVEIMLMATQDSLVTQFYTLIHTMSLENFLCQINANCCNLHLGRSFPFRGLYKLTLWHFDAV